MINNKNAIPSISEVIGCKHIVQLASTSSLNITTQGTTTATLNVSYAMLTGILNPDVSNGFIFFRTQLTSSSPTLYKFSTPVYLDLSTSNVYVTRAYVCNYTSAQYMETDVYVKCNSNTTINITFKKPDDNGVWGEFATSTGHMFILGYFFASEKFN